VGCRTIVAGVVICGGGGTYRRRILRCPVDECMTEVVVHYPDSPWYSPTAMCTRCGEKWSDGELAPRPFARGWRRKQQAKHRALWAAATYGPAPDYREYFAAERKASA
jgi:hypothetical protein